MRYVVFGLSSLIAAASLVLTFRSESSADVLSAAFDKGRVLTATANRGQISLAYVHYPEQLDCEWTTLFTTSEDSLVGFVTNYLNENADRKIAFRSTGIYVSSSPAKKWAMISMPLWLLAFLFVTPGVIVVIEERRRRGRVVAGLCRSCGYDIRACTERCSECGHPVTGSLRQIPHAAEGSE